LADLRKHWDEHGTSLACAMSRKDEDRDGERQREYPLIFRCISKRVGLKERVPNL
jgi:hypothetical protein